MIPGNKNIWKLLTSSQGFFPLPMSNSQRLSLRQVQRQREKKPWDAVGKPASFPVLLVFFDIGYSSSPLKIADLNIYRRNEVLESRLVGKQFICTETRFKQNDILRMNLRICDVYRPWRLGEESHKQKQKKDLTWCYGRLTWCYGRFYVMIRGNCRIKSAFFERPRYPQIFTGFTGIWHPRHYIHEYSDAPPAHRIMPHNP